LRCLQADDGLLSLQFNSQPEPIVISWVMLK